jgi:hypothetical protein
MNDNKQLITEEKTTDDNQPEPEFPPEWLKALKFAKYACGDLGIDDPKEVVEVLRIVLLLGT